MKKIKELGLRAFTDIAFIDYRALGLFRIALGTVLFFDLLTKAFDITAFYTDKGILTRQLAAENMGWWSFSFHIANGSYFFQLLLFFVGIALSLAILVGYQSRIATVAMWVFTISLQERNGLILHSGDALIRLILFWAMFLPLGARYSIDNAADPSLKRRYQGEGVASVASLAILLQLLYVYFFTALLKNHPDWNQNFLAVYYTLNLGQFTTALGNYLKTYIGLTKFLTFTTYYLELFGPILLIIPGIQRYARCLIPFLFIGLHFSLFMTMNLGLFPWICIAAWILFFSPLVMDALENFVFKKLKAPAKSFAAALIPQLPAVSTWNRPQAARITTQLFLIAALIAATLWNLGTISKLHWKNPPILRQFVLPLHLDQYWSMFAPNPMRADGWYVVDGILQDGSSFDTWNKMPPQWDAPAEFFSFTRSTQWRKYLTNVWLGNDNSRDNQLAFGKFICREWNDLSGKRDPNKVLKTYDLYFVRKDTPMPGEIPVFKRVHLWNHDCFASPDPSPKDPRRIGD